MGRVRGRPFALLRVGLVDGGRVGHVGLRCELFLVIMMMMMMAQLLLVDVVVVSLEVMGKFVRVALLVVTDAVIILCSISM